MAETWQLIEDIRALVAREGWQEDTQAIKRLEARIAEATGTVPEIDPRDGHPVAAWIEWGHLDEVVYMIEDVPPFLRSRDAAALLECALVKMLGERDQNPVLSFEVRATIFPESIDEPDCLATVICDSKCVSRLLADSEPVVRTLAALEAGHKLGIWPKEVVPTHG